MTSRQYSTPRAAILMSGDYRLQIGNYGLTIPAREIDRWIVFYRVMAKKYGARTPTYESTAEALESARARALKRAQADESSPPSIGAHAESSQGAVNGGER